jgi:hypothetical protein
MEGGGDGGSDRGIGIEQVSRVEFVALEGVGGRRARSAGRGVGGRGDGAEKTAEHVCARPVECGIAIGDGGSSCRGWERVRG